MARIYRHDGKGPAEWVALDNGDTWSGTPDMAVDILEPGEQITLEAIE